MAKKTTKSPAAIESEPKEPSFEGWAVVELMGHRKITGRVSEATLAGGAFLRIDVPSSPPATQFYAPAAIYCITPTTEATARGYAQRNVPEPVTRWEMPQLAEKTRESEDAEYLEERS